MPAAAFCPRFSPLARAALPCCALICAAAAPQAVIRAAMAQAVTAPLNAMPNPLLQNRALSSYDEKVTRLAEILGSLHYLYNLCGGQTGEWRDYMQNLMAALRPDDSAKARLFAAFNRSYQAFGDSYGSCTAAAKEALERYRLEGRTLSRFLLEHFGNDPAADDAAQE